MRKLRLHGDLWRQDFEGALLKSEQVNAEGGYFVAFPFFICHYCLQIVIFGKAFNILDPHFAHLFRGDSTSFTRFLLEISGLIF